ncbi:MAG: hypothetical protein ACO1RX_00715 [Candidatus Sericytochromatia bacterium]
MPTFAQELIRRQPVLMVLPPSGQTGYETLCSQAMYRTLVQSQAFQVLPDWYVNRELGAPEPWQQDWTALFQRLPEAEQALLLQLNDRAEGPELVSLLLRRSNPPEVLRAEVRALEPAEAERQCELLARDLVGLAEPAPFRNPALSATLSLMVPGAGHFYKGTPESVALGVGILGGWLTLAYLGFSESAPGLTQPQWGGLLLLLTLADVVLAYFLAGQPSPLAGQP